VSAAPTPANRLPEPGPEARLHSQVVQRAVLQRIHEQGPLSFAQYMQFVLYAPGLGYYAAGSHKFGCDGDFVTAPELSDHFGRCVANQIHAVLSSIGGDVLELGAGSGALARVILDHLGPDFGGQYLILEPSADLVQRQRKLLATELPEKLLLRCRWLTSLPAEFTGVILANEVIDAMPVERFVIEAGTIRQWYVDSLAGDLVARVDDADPAVRTAVQHLQQDLGVEFSAGCCSEVNLLLAPWLQALSDSLQCGLCLLIDYGYPRTEYYLAERNSGTLRCYYRHRAHDDVFWYPGLQDITSDVDFTAVVEAGTAAALELHGFTSQGQFLLGNGLVELAQDSAGMQERERLTSNQSVKALSMASGMGERFQVMGLSRSLDMPLAGFGGFDQSHRL